MESFGFTDSIRYVNEMFNYYAGTTGNYEDKVINLNKCNICFTNIKKCNYVSRLFFTTIGHVHIENNINYNINENKKDNVYQCNGSTCNSCKIPICYTCAKQCNDCNRFLCVKCVKYIYTETEKEMIDNASGILYDLDCWHKEYDTLFIPKCQNNCILK
jgi:hypothetical protein